MLHITAAIRALASDKKRKGFGIPTSCYFFMVRVITENAWLPKFRIILTKVIILQPDSTLTTLQLWASKLCFEKEKRSAALTHQRPTYQQQFPIWTVACSMLRSFLSLASLLSLALSHQSPQYKTEHNLSENLHYIVRRASSSCSFLYYWDIFSPLHVCYVIAVNVKVTPFHIFVSTRRSWRCVFHKEAKK